MVVDGSLASFATMYRSDCIVTVAVKGIDGLYAEFQQRAANIIKPLEQRPWGMRDFYVADPDGYIISFGQ